MSKVITVESSNGHFVIDSVGTVLENHYEGDDYKGALKFDLNEYHLWMSIATGKLCSELESEYDILCVGCWLTDGTYLPAELTFRNELALSNKDLLQNGNLTTNVDLANKKIELKLHNDSTTLSLPSEETWIYTKVGGINVAVQIDFDSEENEKGFNIDMYTYSDTSFDDAILSGKSLNDCIDFNDEVEVKINFI